MRGKSVDSEFVSEFVAVCVSNQMTTPKDISSEARIRISKIDSEIKRIDTLKAERSKLMDVVNAFDPETDEPEVEQEFPEEEPPSVDDFEVKVCAVIDSMSSASVNDILSSIGENSRRAVFLTIKRLCEKGVITRDAKHTFVRGPRWVDSAESKDSADAS
jgi:hypothetical protein